MAPLMSTTATDGVRMPQAYCEPEQVPIQQTHVQSGTLRSHAAELLRRQTLAPHAAALTTSGKPDTGCTPALCRTRSIVRCEPRCGACTDTVPECIPTHRVRISRSFSSLIIRPVSLDADQPESESKPASNDSNAFLKGRSRCSSGATPRSSSPRSSMSGM